MGTRSRVRGLWRRGGHATLSWSHTRACPPYVCGTGMGEQDGHGSFFPCGIARKQLGPLGGRNYLENTDLLAAVESANITAEPEMIPAWKALGATDPLAKRRRARTAGASPGRVLSNPQNHEADVARLLRVESTGGSGPGP